MNLETAYAEGQLAALRHLKLAWPAPTNPTVANSAVLRAKAPSDTSAQIGQSMKPPTTPFEVSQVFDAHEQGKTRTEPRRKLSADICTSCRKDKHYGPCNAPKKIPTKAADFNMGLTGDDPSTGNNPSTSPHYHSATTADSALARARDGRPADEQAGSAFADLYRHLGITNIADEPGRMTGGLNKVAEVFNVAKYRARRHAILEKMFGIDLSKRADWQLWGTDGHSQHEDRGPSPNPYEERKTRKGPPVGWGPEGEQRIDRMFREFDNPVDSANVGGGFGDPQPGPAVLG